VPAIPAVSGWANRLSTCCITSDGQQVLAEATLAQVLGRLATWANDVTGAPVRYNPTRALQTLSLVVAS